MIKHFLNRSEQCPKIMAATHFFDIFGDDMLSASLPISYLHMDILIKTSSGWVDPNVEAGDWALDDEATQQEGEEGSIALREKDSEPIVYLYK